MWIRYIQSNHLVVTCQIKTMSSSSRSEYLSVQSRDPLLKTLVTEKCLSISCGGEDNMCKLRAIAQ